MSKQILAFAAIVAIASLVIFNMETKDSMSVQFELFKNTHGKTYSTSEQELYRKSVFMMNLAKINAHNADKTQTYEMGVNTFTDLTQQQFVSTFLGTHVNKKFVDVQHKRTIKPASVGDVDWVAQGKVSAVKNQGSCGSCWAFSTTGAIESAYLIDGKALTLSEQQLVDCSSSYGNNGCNGGWMAFQYVIDHGITTQQAYPYVAKDQKCQKNSGDYKISSYVDIDTCSDLQNALNSRPVSIAVDATNWSSYKSGIFSNCAKNINHGVLAVGYSLNNYWKVKNSWGQSWGEKGYIRVKFGDTCAICDYASYPIK